MTNRNLSKSSALNRPGVRCLTTFSLVSASHPGHVGCSNASAVRGDARGWLTNTSAVALTFGVSLAPFGKAEYRTRQLAWTEVSWDEGGA